MEETICDKQIRKQRFDEIRKWLHKRLDFDGTYYLYGNAQHRHIEVCELKTYYVNEWVGFRVQKVKEKQWGKTLIKINKWNSDFASIEVFDKNLYNVAKEFGEHFGFKELVKCWDGVADE